MLHKALPLGVNRETIELTKVDKERPSDPDSTKVYTPGTSGYLMHKPLSAIKHSKEECHDNGNQDFRQDRT